MEVKELAVDKIAGLCVGCFAKEEVDGATDGELVGVATVKVRQYFMRSSDRYARQVSRLWEPSIRSSCTSLDSNQARMRDTLRVWLPGWKKKRKKKKIKENSN